MEGKLGKGKGWLILRGLLEFAKLYSPWIRKHFSTIMRTM